MTTAAEWLIQAATRELPVGGVGPSTAAAIAAAVRTELATELALIDRPISSRIESGTLIGANVIAVRGQHLSGQGTDENPWRPG